MGGGRVADVAFDGAAEHLGTEVGDHREDLLPVLADLVAVFLLDLELDNDPVHSAAGRAWVERNWDRLDFVGVDSYFPLAATAEAGRGS